MRQHYSSLPLAFMLAAAAQTPGTVVGDILNPSRSLQPGALSALVGRAPAVGIASDPQGDNHSQSYQRTAQRFLNFLNCSSQGKRC